MFYFSLLVTLLLVILRFCTKYTTHNNSQSALKLHAIARHANGSVWETPGNTL